MKKLKILLLTDSLSLGGAQTHLLSLYNALLAHGHCITVASSGGVLAKGINHKKINLSSRSPIKLAQSFFELRSLLRRQKFDIIHAHARIPALLAVILAKLYSIPFVTTAHAKFKVSPLRKRLSFWGDRTIAVSDDLRYYLSSAYSVPSENIEVIENCIDTSIFTPSSDYDPFRILFLSRLDGDCSLLAELLCDIAPSLCALYPSLSISIGGGGSELKRLTRLCDSANKKIGKKAISLVGNVNDVPAFLSDGGIFIGVSRASLEAISSAIPTIIAGNEGFLGHLTTKNYPLAKSTNFCARNSEVACSERLFDSIISILANYPKAKKEAFSLREKTRHELDFSLLAERTETFYHSAIALQESKKEKRPQTLLFGYYGYSNLGDDALLRASILRAKSEFGSSVGAFTHSPKKAKSVFSIPCFSRKNPFSLILHLKHSKRLIFGGGTLFQTITSRRSFFFYIFVLRIAKLLGNETVIYANGIGELKSNRQQRLLTSTLASCSHIGIRDKSSLELLKKHLPLHKGIRYEPDLSLSLCASSEARALFLIKSALKERGDRFFTVAIRRGASPLERFELEQRLKEEKRKGLFPLFIVCSPADLYPSYGLYLKFGGGILCKISFADLLSILPRSSLTISMRYHPLLASRAVGTPYIAIGSDKKLEEFSS